MLVKGFLTDDELDKEPKELATLCNYMLLICLPPLRLHLTNNARIGRVTNEARVKSSERQSFLYSSILI